MNTATATQAPFWTAFEAQALSRADWSNHASAHRAVMDLFDADMGADPRSAAQILYRVDTQPDGRQVVLVQSSVQPEKAPLSARTMRVGEDAWHLRAGAQVMLRLAVCPVIRSRDPQTGKQIVRVVPEEKLSTWLEPRLKGALGEVQILNDARHATVIPSRARRHLPKAAPPRVAIATIDAIATIADPDALDTLRREGIGRYKAYGAGLLTARQIG